MWSQIFTAVALVLVIEGLLPCINPGGWKQAMRQMLEVDEERLRWFGLASMAAGALLLVLVN